MRRPITNAKSESTPKRTIVDTTVTRKTMAERRKPSSRVQQAPPPSSEPVPDVDAEGAEELGRRAYIANQPITSNPFPWDDPRRPRFDAGWRAESGSDGMGDD